MIEQITKEFLVDKVEKFETKKIFSSNTREENKLYLKDVRYPRYVGNASNIDEAIDFILSNEEHKDYLATLYFEEEYLKYKLLNGINLNYDQLKWLIHEDSFEEVSREEGENRRWSRIVTIVRKVDDRYFEISYDQGLTESQEDSYDYQPEEVFRHEEVITKTVVTYLRKPK